MKKSFDLNDGDLESKKLLEASHILPWQEWATRLRDLLEIDGHLIACGSNDSIILPLELKVDLKRHLGRRISILRTDTDYRMLLLDCQSPEGR